MTGEASFSGRALDLNQIMTIASDTPIFLIGYRGTGKSTVARELAERLGFDWIDADDEIEQPRRQNRSPRSFARTAKRRFAIWKPTSSPSWPAAAATVIALGGGAVLREANRQAIRAAGPVVWLTASVDTILERLAADAATASRRPNLTTAGGRAEIEAVLAARTPIYRECATLVVDTEGKTAAEVADEIVANL